MNEHEKIPAQGGEMPPVERAADTGGRGIDTVRGATSAGNAAQQRAIPWAHTQSGAVRRGIDASKMARRDYGLTDDDSGRHDFDAGFRYGTKYGHFTSARATGAQAAMITSLECAAQWLEHGKDPKAAAAEIHACLAKLDATPAAPVAELVPDPLSRRVERLLVELHAEGRLSEGQCAKMLNISRVDWRELAEFLAPATQAVAADGARTKDVVTREQVEAWAQQAEIETGWLNERFIAALGDFAIFARAAVSPATADVHAAFLAWTVDPSFYNWNKSSQCYAHHFNAGFKAARASQAAAPAEMREQFQARVQPWMMECFGPTIAADRVERNHRFLEEALELVQSLGCTASEAHQLVDYTFGRPIGEPAQEVGGVMVTLAALCLANTLDMHAAGETELARISAPAMVEKIRAKQAAKPKHSPLPETPANPGEAVATNLDRHMITVWRNGKWKLWTYGEACLAGRDRDWLINISIPPMVQGAQGGKGGKA